jgi:hypothetical protein
MFFGLAQVGELGEVFSETETPPRPILHAPWLLQDSVWRGDV